MRRIEECKENSDNRVVKFAIVNSNSIIDLNALPDDLKWIDVVQTDGNPCLMGQSISVDLKSPAFKKKRQEAYDYFMSLGTPVFIDRDSLDVIPVENINFIRPNK